MIRIHKEGKKIIVITVLLVLIINAIFVSLIQNLFIVLPLTIASLIPFFLILRFFRNPTRHIAPNDNLIVSPADGTVVVIEEATEKEYFKDNRLQVSIFMSIHDVHLNRYPVSGKITYSKYHEGDYLLARHPKSSELNERSTVVIKTNSGREILVRQIAGAVARRIIPYSKEGIDVIQGDELGFIRFGSRVDLLLPLGTKLNVTLNQKTKGNLTIIGEF